MRFKERLQALARHAARRPWVTIGVVLAVAAAGGILALGLKPSAATSTFVSTSSASYRATQADYAHFGGNAVVILVREPLPQIVETNDIATLSELEACFAGQTLKPNKNGYALLPAAGPAPYGGTNSPCGRFGRTHDVQVVYGPATFLNRLGGRDRQRHRPAVRLGPAGRPTEG